MSTIIVATYNDFLTAVEGEFRHHSARRDELMAAVRSTPSVGDAQRDARRQLLDAYAEAGLVINLIRALSDAASRAYADTAEDTDAVETVALHDRVNDEALHIIMANNDRAPAATQAVKSIRNAIRNASRMAAAA